MEDMLRNSAEKLCKVMTDNNARDVVGLSLGPECSWASFLLIGTATSRVHLNGVAAEIREAMKGMDMDCSGGKRNDNSNWHIIDGGSIVVSLMDSEAREFYALEERWYEAEVIIREQEK